MRICIIFNPSAKGEKAKRWLQLLDEVRGECVLKQTWAAGAARTLAAEAVWEGFDTIVAAGGDGTVNEVLNGIGAEPDGFARARLAILPMGTVNVFAKELGLPGSLPRAWEIIRRGREMAVDLPRVEFTADGQRQFRYFAQMAGAGLDARAVELVNWKLKKKFGLFAYIWACLQALRETQSKILATTGTRSFTGEAIVLGNGRFYGGKYVLFPKANLSDGLIDVCVLPRANWKVAISCGWGALTQRLHKAGGMQHFQSETLTLTSERPTPFQVEGESVGRLPATFSVQRQKLRVVVP